MGRLKVQPEGLLWELALQGRDELSQVLEDAGLGDLDFGGWFGLFSFHVGLLLDFLCRRSWREVDKD